MNIKIISLKSSLRRKFQLRQFAKLSITFEFFDATSIHDISEKEYSIHKNDWERPLKRSEFACYISHREVWKEVIKLNKPILILEDDALLSRELLKILKKIDSVKKIDLLNIENRGRNKMISNKVKFHIENFALYRLLQDRTGAASYVLWPSGAKKLLDCEKIKGYALADAQISNCKKLKAFQIEPALVIQLDMCRHYGLDDAEFSSIKKSTVSSKKRLKKNIKTTINRIKSQLILALWQIAIFPISKRRKIKLADKSSFFHLTD